MNVKMTAALLALCLTLLCGCSRPADADPKTTQTAPVPQQEAVMAAPSETDMTVPTPVNPARQDQVGDATNPPEDSPEYFTRVVSWNKTWASKNIDAYPYPPSFTRQWEDKYPVFDRLDCSIDDAQTQVSCTFEAQPNDIDELDLVSWLPYLSNRDVLNPLLRCTSVCINQDSVLVGAVQPAMSQWMQAHCKVTATGRSC
jgi:hypothetical protein